MKSLQVVGAGVLAGLVGAAVWAGISYAAKLEVGWVAWGIGGLVGLAVRVTAREWEGAKPGVIAVGIALLSIVAGKYLAVHFLVEKELSGMDVSVTDSDMIESIAAKLCKDRLAQGKRLAWPAGMTIEKASKPEDYPRDVWADATKQWNATPAAEKAKKIAEEKKQFEEIKNMVGGAVRQHAFKDSFSPFDALWFLLASLTAYRLGAGTFSSD
jgi:hypothetical protein